MFVRFFVSQFNDARRGHRYKLYLPPCRSNVRFNCLNYRTIRTWNSLPADVDFSSLNSFRSSLNRTLLIPFCRVLFIWLNSYNIVSGQSGPFVLINVCSTIAASIVHSKLDYCNSLCYNLPKSQINCLQQMQNTSLRTGVKAPRNLLILTSHPSSELCTGSRLMNTLNIETPLTHL